MLQVAQKQSEKNEAWSVFDSQGRCPLVTNKIINILNQMQMLISWNAHFHATLWQPLGSAHL